ncbi:chemokine C-C motif receptor-like 2 [Anoplophora glabripennis]|uniref:chemokine C-C motif receptor-like 2 n=1 Tax=Anoplophora glabripennis TaxID=217634 RepID=UPI000874D33D|nr:chemokine C-C motif receptor-like 2 [Anoplophora glabripennis]
MGHSSNGYVNSSRNISEETKSWKDEYHKRFLEAYILVSLVCIIANILIIFVILKYKRLRQEKWNIIILNWAIINCPLMMTAPITFGLAVYASHLVPQSAFCFVYHMEFTLFLIDIVLIVILTVYWYMKLYHTEKHKKFDQHIKCVLIFVYIFLISLTALNIDACFNSRIFTLTGLILVITYLAFVLFMPIINIVHAVKKRRLVDYSNRKNVPFMLSNILFLSHLPGFLVLFATPFLSPFTNQILSSIAFFIAILNPVYFFIVLYHGDRNYNIFLKHVFSCRCREYNDELVEQPVSYNNGVENKC